MPFQNLFQLVFILEELLDSMYYPQKEMESRSFKEKSETIPQRRPGFTWESKDDEIIASFKISVLFRQSASWQGSIVWMENQVESQFRSLLELLFLIDSVLVG